MKYMISKFLTILIFCLIITGCNTSGTNNNNVLVSDLNNLKRADDHFSGIR